jgi:hypothetical protein
VEKLNGKGKQVSNTKNVLINGWIPFDFNATGCLENNNTSYKELQAFIGQCRMPCYGIKFNILNEYKNRPNLFGGQTTMYHFNCYGFEAISYPALRKMLDIMKECECEIQTAEAWEENEKPINLLCA